MFSWEINLEVLRISWKTFMFKRGFNGLEFGWQTINEAILNLARVRPLGAAMPVNELIFEVRADEIDGGFVATSKW
jgi:hypothetical protein